MQRPKPIYKKVANRVRNPFPQEKAKARGNLRELFQETKKRQQLQTSVPIPDELITETHNEYHRLLVGYRELLCIVIVLGVVFGIPKALQYYEGMLTLEMNSEIFRSDLSELLAQTDNLDVNDLVSQYHDLIYDELKKLGVTQEQLSLMNTQAMQKLMRQKFRDLQILEKAEELHNADCERDPANCPDNDQTNYLLTIDPDLNIPTSYPAMNTVCAEIAQLLLATHKIPNNTIQFGDYTAEGIAGNPFLVFADDGSELLHFVPEGAYGKDGVAMIEDKRSFDRAVRKRYPSKDLSHVRYFARTSISEYLATGNETTDAEHCLRVNKYTALRTEIFHSLPKPNDYINALAVASGDCDLIKSLLGGERLSVGDVRKIITRSGNGGNFYSTGALDRARGNDLGRVTGRISTYIARAKQQLGYSGRSSIGVRGN